MIRDKRMEEKGAVERRGRQKEQEGQANRWEKGEGTKNGKK